ncbi:MAG: hypothetical protein DSY76_01450 [Bacteroidetes bacterium]|nr:MAG: hypothetical protein DSY76_01450 [Bacteroidota bacterium]
MTLNGRIILFLLLFVPSLLWAQNYEPLRAEFSSKQYDQMQIFPASKNRVIVFRHYAKRYSKGDLWKVTGLDKALKTVWEKDVIAPRMYSLSDMELTNDSILHILLVKRSGEGGSFLKIRMNINDGYYTSYLFKGNRRSLLVGLKNFNNQLYLYGVGLEYMQSELDKYNAKTTTEKIVSAKIPSKYYIISALADTVRNRFLVLVKDIKSAEGKLRLLDIDNHGDIITASLLSSSEGHNIIDGNLVYSDDSELLFIGTYNNVKPKKRRRDDENAIGVFIGKIDHKAFGFIKYYPFTAFKNIFNTLNFREQQKLKNMEAKGRSVELNFRLLMHNRILKQNGQYILVAESYYPVYHYETMYDARGYMYQTEVFDGYKTTYAIAAAFDAKGNFLWDNYIEVKDVQNYYLNEIVTAYTDDDTQVFMYYLNENVYFKVCNKDKTLYKKEATSLPTVKQGEQVLAEDYGRIVHWYGPYFLISGYQKILNRGSKSRKVFFVMGVSFE